MDHTLELDSASSAVLVIDVQNGLFNGKPPAFEGDQVIARINEVTAKARSAGALVIIFQHEGDPSENWMVPFSDDWKLHPRLHVTAKDLTFRKTTCDAFYETKLETELADQRISRLVLTGFATDFCIDTTLRIALSKGFEVVVIADAHTTTDGPVLRADQIQGHFNWAWQNCSAKSEVQVVPAREIAFSPRR
jgi:nicotinamidase-related amidase